jgi:hypothetical protein
MSVTGRAERRQVLALAHDEGADADPAALLQGIPESA